MTPAALADRLEKLIADVGPIPVSVYVEAALYDDDDGFYTSPAGGVAGRRGDFLTSPEVGPLFGAVVARAMDGWWHELGRPEEYTVHEWGAGPGTLARSVLAAEPEVLTSGALRLVLIEQSPRQRAQHPEHPNVDSTDRPPAGSIVGLVLANELLDNLPFDVYERIDDGWAPVLIGPRDESGRFTTTLDAVVEDAPLPEGVARGTRVPVPALARQWLSDRRSGVAAGRLVVIDYGADTKELAARDGGWLRTHVAHGGTADWLRDPGSCDITTDVPFDQLQLDLPADQNRRQDEWLTAHGIHDLVEEGRAVWSASAGVGDLAALRARSRIREAEALLDPDGMGAFRVLEWSLGP